MHVCCEEPRTQGEKALIVTSLPVHSRLTKHGETLCPFLAQPYDISSQRLFKRR